MSNIIKNDFSQGSRYWRNRVARVAKKFKDQSVTFAIANKGIYSRNIDDWKLDAKQDVLVAAKNQKGEVFLMQDVEFRFVM